MSQKTLLVGTRIKQICDSMGISVRQCERNAGIPERSISRWDINAPSVDRVAAVAKSLNMSVDELLWDEPTKSKPSNEEKNPAIETDDGERSNTDSQSDYIMGIFRQLTFENQVRAANELESLRRQQEAQDGQKGSG